MLRFEMSYTDQSRFLQDYDQHQLDTLEQNHLSVLLVRDVIKKHHGLFDFHSSSGQGTCFKIKFTGNEVKISHA